MKFSMTGQEKSDLLIQVASWTGLIVLSTSDIFFSLYIYCLIFLDNVNNHISHVTYLRYILSVMREISSF